MLFQELSPTPLCSVLYLHSSQQLVDCCCFCGKAVLVVIVIGFCFGCCCCDSKQALPAITSLESPSPALHIGISFVYTGRLVVLKLSSSSSFSGHHHCRIDFSARKIGPRALLQEAIPRRKRTATSDKRHKIPTPTSESSPTRRIYCQQLCIDCGNQVRFCHTRNHQVRFCHTCTTTKSDYYYFSRMPS